MKYKAKNSAYIFKIMGLNFSNFNNQVVKRFSVTNANAPNMAAFSPNEEIFISQSAAS